jgi:sugar transferase (PEP-CTERM/EpsH1 system associated)
VVSPGAFRYARAVLETRPLRILFLAPRLPWPLDTGGKIRTYYLLRALARRHEVTLLSFLDPEDSEREGPRELVRLGIPHELVPSPSRLHLLFSLGLGLAGPTPFTIRKYQVGALAARVAARARRGEVDLVHCDHLHMAPYGARARLPFVVDEHNVETVIWERFASDRSEPWWKRLVFREQALWLRRLEAELCRRASLVLTCSSVDREVLRTIAGGPRALAEGLVVPNGVDLEAFGEPGPSATGGGGHLVFTGSMDWAPNENAAHAFLDEIWPAVRASLGAVRFYIVGRNPSGRLRSRARPGEVVVTGTVPDVRPFLRNALALVVPMRVGGGTRLKILEAFAARIPVVSTRVGIEGIEARPGEHYLAAEDARGFADALQRLAAEPALRRELTEAGHRLAAERYSWAAVGARLAEVYAERFGR